MQVDGLPLRGGNGPANTLQAVIGSFTGREQRLLQDLQRAFGRDIGIIDGHFDDVATLLAALGFRGRPIAGEDLSDCGLPVVALGCPHRHTRLDEVDSGRFFEHGGILVSSDMAARLPGIAAHLGHQRGRPPARGRIARFSADAPAEPFAPIWLDPGHLPLSSSVVSKTPVTTLALNPMTGEALVVSVAAGAGTLIHSVPHWLQTPHESAMTSVERRPLRDVPRYRHIGNSYSGIALGAFLAQRSMVEVLLESLARAADVTVQADCSRQEREA